MPIRTTISPKPTHGRPQKERGKRRGKEAQVCQYIEKRRRKSAADPHPHNIRIRSHHHGAPTNPDRSSGLMNGHRFLLLFSTSRAKRSLYFVFRSEKMQFLPRPKSCEKSWSFSSWTERGRALVCFGGEAMTKVRPCVFALDWLKGRLSFLLAMEMKKVVTKTVF